MTADTTDESAAEAPKELQFYPFAYALLDDELNNHCWYCLKASTELKRCVACKTAWFCTKECQRSGWTDHKPECQGFAAKLAKGKPIPRVEVRMLGRIAWRHKCIEEGKDRKDKDFYKNRMSERKIMELWSHSDDMAKDPDAHRKFVDLDVALQLFYDAKYLPEPEIVWELHCRNYINRHAINDASFMREIAKGLYLDLCAYNHSCRPNAVFACDGVVATLRPLNSSVDLRNRNTTAYTYIDLLTPRHERRALLRKEYYFKCECDRCVDPKDLALCGLRCEFCGGNVPLDGLNSGEHDSECLSCKKTCTGEKVKAARTLMRSVIKILETDGKVPQPLVLKTLQAQLSDCNIYIARLIRSAILATGATDYERMLDLHLQAEACMRHCYPCGHPALAYHLMNTAVFYDRTDGKDRAEKYINEALDMFRSALGEKHAMTRTCEDHKERILKQ